jgi:hypothetical protein
MTLPTLAPTLPGLLLTLPSGGGTLEYANNYGQVMLALIDESHSFSTTTSLARSELPIKLLVDNVDGTGSWVTAATTPPSIKPGTSGIYEFSLQLSGGSGGLGDVSLGFQLDGLNYMLTNDDSAGATEALSGSVILDCVAGSNIYFMVLSNATVTRTMDAYRVWVKSVAPYNGTAYASLPDRAT